MKERKRTYNSSKWKEKKKQNYYNFDDDDDCEKLTKFNWVCIRWRFNNEYLAAMILKCVIDGIAY